MVEVKRVEEEYRQVERVIKEDVLVRPEGYVLFLTKAEAEGLRSLLYTGVGTDVLDKLELDPLCDALRDAGVSYNNPGWDGTLQLRKKNS